MTNCWSIGLLLALFLGSCCIWNCLNRKEDKEIADWHGCIDQNGKPADFFIMYKLPKDKDGKYTLVEEGTAYMYLTPDPATRLQSGGVSSVLSYSDSSSHWVLSNISIGNQLSMPGRTLRRLYTEASFKDNNAFILYNDEFPNGITTFTEGHTKGIVTLGSQGGVWLIHSVPKYPPESKDGYSFPKTGHTYGQSFLCISLPPATKSVVENIGWQLIHNGINIYESNIPKNMEADYPILDKIRKHEKPSPPFYRVTQVTSQTGKKFTSFAKFKTFGKDLYSGLVAPLLQTGLLVESWRNGEQPLPSDCNDTYTVENVNRVEAKAASIDFSTHKDHSKWAVGKDSDQPYVCIGDINRMKTQFERSGGTVCLWSLSVWYRFNGLIKGEDSCPPSQDTLVH